MTDNFSLCLPVLLKEEGGYVDNPHDPGGITNLGVTKKVWESWTGTPATASDMALLRPATVAPLYRVQYWRPIDGDALPLPIAMCVFDMAVNSGVSRAARLLQELVGVVQDGHIGQATVAALDAYIAKHNLVNTVVAYQAARLAFYKSLANYKFFGKGWKNRVEAVEHEALGMVK